MSKEVGTECKKIYVAFETKSQSVLVLGWKEISRGAETGKGALGFGPGDSISGEKGD